MEQMTASQVSEFKCPFYEGNCCADKCVAWEWRDKTELIVCRPNDMNSTVVIEKPQYYFITEKTGVCTIVESRINA